MFLATHTDEEMNLFFDIIRLLQIYEEKPEYYEKVIKNAKVCLYFSFRDFVFVLLNALLFLHLLLWFFCILLCAIYKTGVLRYWFNSWADSNWFDILVVT
jgi:hypothetical protein